MIKRALCLVTILATVLVSGCSQNSAEMHDGYYTAEMAEFSHGWKEYITIYVNDNQIVTADYNAFNPSGFLKTWDMEYMRVMTTSDGTYPNEFRRAYETALLNWQEPIGVDALSGATHSHTTFELLANAAIAQAKSGSKHIALVEIESAEN